MTPDGSVPLPSLERARAEGLRLIDRDLLPWNRQDLIQAEPTRVRCEAGLVVRALVLCRRSHEMEDEVGDKTLHTFAVEVPSPKQDFGEQLARVLVEMIDREPRKCGHCILSGGRQACATCGGEGVYGTPPRDGDIAESACGPCRGTGRITCPKCDGLGTTRRVLLRYIEDRVDGMDAVFLPELPDDLATLVENALVDVDAFRDSLRYTLEQRHVSAGPYRSGGVDREPTFHGFPVSAALTRARQRVQILLAGGEMLQFAAECWAIPILHAVYEGDAEIAVFPGGSGRLHGVAVNR